MYTTKGVKILACCSLAIGIVVSSILVYSIILEERLQKDLVLHARNKTSHIMQHVFGSHLDRTSIDLIIILVLLVAILFVVFAILLLVGIEKNMPGLVLSYLGFGVFLFLFLMVGAVLQFLQSWWYRSVVSILAALLLLVRLPSVYFLYEEMKDEEPSLITNMDRADTEFIENIDFEVTFS